MEQIFMQGWLKKQSGALKQWAKRWFCLKGPAILYGKTQTATSDSIHVLTVKKIEYDPNKLPSSIEKKKKTCGFIIETSDAKKIYLLAETDKEREQWMSALQKWLSLAQTNPTALGIHNTTQASATPLDDEDEDDPITAALTTPTTSERSISPEPVDFEDDDELENVLQKQPEIKPVPLLSELPKQKSDEVSKPPTPREANTKTSPVVSPRPVTSPENSPREIDDTNMKKLVSVTPAGEIALRFFFSCEVLKLLYLGVDITNDIFQNSMKNSNSLYNTLKETKKINGKETLDGVVSSHDAFKNVIDTQNPRVTKAKPTYEKPMAFFTEKLDTPCALFIFSEDYSVVLALYRVASAQAYWIFLAEDADEKKMPTLISVKTLDLVEKQIKRALENLKKNITVYQVRKKEQVTATIHNPSQPVAQQSTPQTSAPSIPKLLKAQSAMHVLPTAQPPAVKKTDPQPQVQQQQQQIQQQIALNNKLEEDIKNIFQQLSSYKSENDEKVSVVQSSLKMQAASLDETKAEVLEKVEQVLKTSLVTSSKVSAMEEANGKIKAYMSESKLYVNTQFQKLSEKTQMIEDIIQNQLLQENIQMRKMESIRQQVLQGISEQFNTVNSQFLEVKDSVASAIDNTKNEMEKLRSDSETTLSNAINMTKQEMRQENSVFVEDQILKLETKMSESIQQAVEALNVRLSAHENNTNTKISELYNSLQQAKDVLTDFDKIHQLSFEKQKQLEESIVILNSNIRWVQQQYLQQEQNLTNTMNAIVDMKQELLTNFEINFKQLESQLVDRHIQLQDMLVDIRAKESILSAKENALKERSQEFIGKYTTDLQPTPYFQSLVSPTKPTILREPASPSTNVTPFSLALFSKQDSSTPSTPKVKNDHQFLISEPRTPGFQNSVQLSTPASANLYIHSPARKLQYPTKEAEPRAIVTEPSPLRKFSNQYMSSLYSGYQPASPSAAKSAYWDSISKK